MGSDGNLYKSLVGTEETHNVNNNPTLSGSVSWKSIFTDFTDFAKINGDETKRFKVADATELSEAINKKQFDNNAVKLNGNQTINDVKTFLKSPIVPAPTTPTQAVNKQYVDENAGIEIATTVESQAGTNDTKAITPLKLRQGLNANGNAPIYACRAWVNFNGTGTVSIGASGNVSSVTDNGTGDYIVNFTTAMSDINYSCVITVEDPTGLSAPISNQKYNTKTASSVGVRCWNYAGASVDARTASMNIKR